MALAEVQLVGSGVLEVNDAVVVYSGMNVKQRQPTRYWCNLEE